MQELDPYEASLHPERASDPTNAETRRWALILHLSQFSGWVVPFAGFIVPILIWQLKKEELPGLDVHGRAVANWMISGLIYCVICVLLCFVLIGFILLPIFGVLTLVYPILGAIRAANGEHWSYPPSFRIF